MNHQERMELLGALSRLGVAHYKSHDLEINFGTQPRGPEAWRPADEPTPMVKPPVVEQNDDSTEKLKGLIETLKMDDASLIDKIFPAGAGL